MGLILNTTSYDWITHYILIIRSHVTVKMQKHTLATPSTGGHVWNELIHAHRVVFLWQSLLRLRAHHREPCEST